MSCIVLQPEQHRPCRPAYLQAPAWREGTHTDTKLFTCIAPQLDYSAGIFSKAGKSRTRLRQNGLNFRPSLLRHLKYASISAFLIFDGTTILLRFGSQKFVPPYFFIRRSTNLQIDCRLSKVSARQVGKYGEPNRNRFDFCLPPIKLSSKKLRNLVDEKVKS